MLSVAAQQGERTAEQVCPAPARPAPVRPVSAAALTVEDTATCRPVTEPRPDKGQHCFPPACPSGRLASRGEPHAGGPIITCPETLVQLIRGIRGTAGSQFAPV